MQVELDKCVECFLCGESFNRYVDLPPVRDETIEEKFGGKDAALLHLWPVCDGCRDEIGEYDIPDIDDPEEIDHELVTQYLDADD